MYQDICTNISLANTSAIIYNISCIGMREVTGPNWGSNAQVNSLGTTLNSSFKFQQGDPEPKGAERQGTLTHSRTFQVFVSQLMTILLT